MSTQWPDWLNGAMEHSRRLTDVTLYRYQKKAYLDLTDTWYHMVWDMDRKWTAKNRFSGADISPGHFFSVSEGGAQAEMHAYDAPLEEHELLEFTISIDNLLDLTERDALRWFHKKHFESQADWHWAVVLDSLFDQQTGGDVHNAYAGHKALLDGYNGIVFFGARACAQYWTNPGSMQNRNWNLIDLYREMMIEDPDCVNVVIYFGHSVVQSTRRIECSGKTMVNRLFGAPISRIDEVFAADPARPPEADLSFEAERVRTEQIAWISRPGIVEEQRKPIEKKPG